MTVDDMTRASKMMANAESTATYFGGGKESPLIAACKQVFKWAGQTAPLFVIVWHEDWVESYWDQLAAQLKSPAQGTRYLVVFFNDNLDDCRKGKGGSKLSLLWRLLGQDPDHPQGWCRITDFAGLGKSQKELPKPEDYDADLRKRANEILGFSINGK